MQIRPHLRRPNCLFDFNAPVSRTCLIQEAMHVYRSDDLSYEKIIKKGILALFKNIRAGNLVQVFKNDKTLYATTDITLNIVTSKTISLYMNVVNYGPLSNNICDAVNISQPTFGYEKDDIVDEQYPLCTENKASIIFTVSPDVPAKNNKTCVLKAAKHELMHIYHDQLKPKLNTLAGDAMWYCEQILRIHQLSFPNESDIHMLLYKSSLTSLDYVLLLAACMYYTDKSESSAFMETFNVESINIIRRGRIYRYKKHVILQNMQSSKTYTIYAGMYKLLQVHYHDFYNAISEDVLVMQIFNEYCRNLGFPKLKSVIPKWIHTTGNFKKHAIAVHKHNIEQLIPD